MIVGKINIQGFLQRYWSLRLIPGGVTPSYPAGEFQFFMVHSQIRVSIEKFHAVHENDGISPT